jgi:hypothetical protein
MVDFSLLRQPNYMAVALGAAQAGAALGAQNRRDDALREFGQTGDIGALERSGDADLLGLADKRREAAREAAKIEAKARVIVPALGGPDPSVPKPVLGSQEEGSSFTPSEAGPAPQQPQQAPTTPDGFAINWAALREYAVHDPDDAIKLAEFATKADAARLKQVQDHGERKARVAFVLRQQPAGPAREAAFAAMKPKLLALGFTQAEIDAVRLDDASLEKDIAFGMTLYQMVDKADRDRAFAATERQRQNAEARAARGEQRAETRFRERALDRKAIAASGGSFDSLLSAFRGE